MKATTKRALCVVTALAVSNWFAAAADMNGAPRANDQNSSQQTTPGDNQGSATVAVPPQEFNKASGIVGMDVQNQQGEHLGHIKDIVFDLNSQRISYAVLTTSSKAMPINEKLLAVPLNAFTVSPDQKHLILNADKQKVENGGGLRVPELGRTSAIRPGARNRSGSRTITALGRDEIEFPHDPKSVKLACGRGAVVFYRSLRQRRRNLKRGRHDTGT